MRVQVTPTQTTPHHQPCTVPGRGWFHYGFRFRVQGFRIISIHLNCMSACLKMLQKPAHHDPLETASRPRFAAPLHPPAPGLENRLQDKSRRIWDLHRTNVRNLEPCNQNPLGNPPNSRTSQNCSGPALEPTPQPAPEPAPEPAAELSPQPSPELRNLLALEPAPAAELLPHPLFRASAPLQYYFSDNKVS